MTEHLPAGEDTEEEYRFVLEAAGAWELASGLRIEFQRAILTDKALILHTAEGLKIFTRLEWRHRLGGDLDGETQVSFGNAEGDITFAINLSVLEQIFGKKIPIPPSIAGFSTKTP